MSDLNSEGDGLLKSQVISDMLGRTIESRQYETASAFIAVRKTYDIPNRLSKTSNPFRAGESVVWTTTLTDLAGRVVSVTTPDNAVVGTSYWGNTVTVTDQANNQRKSQTDGLGRLVHVYEDPNGAHYVTSYAYDPLDNLTNVYQGSQTRSFAYDSLKRLTAATNPESGTISYKYDENGNLLVKTDARGVSSHYEYDALNRVKRRWYNGSSSLTAATPNSPVLPSGVGASDEVKYFYDSEALPTGAPTFDRGYAVGRLVATTYGGGSAGDYYGFDALGRAKLKIQQTGSINYQTTAIYNLAGAMTSMSYPSGRTITNTFDGAGRLSSFTGYLGDGTQRTYANDFEYTAWNGLQQEKFGTTTPIYHKQRYNARGQLWDMRASTVSFATDPANGDRGAIVNYYSNNYTQGGSGTDNNGNLLRQENYIPGSSFFQDNFEYDHLNRLKFIAEKLNGTGTDSFKQAYVYDRWGNRTIDQVSTSPNVPKPDFGVDTANNRLTAPAGYTMTYDQAGNLTNDTFTGEGVRTFDAENRMTGAQASLPASYAYDGDGHRIKRIVHAVETWQVYGIGGELLAEYPATGAPSNPQKEYGYRNGELLITAEAGVGGSGTERVNVALASNGSTATASSTYAGYGHSAAAAVDGEHKGLNWLSGGGWNGATNTFPQWLQVDFNGSKTIGEIDVFTVQDNYANPSEPTETMTFSLYGLSGFDVQYWNGSAWATVPGGSVTGNNKVWKKISFAPITTTKIRVLTNAAPDGYSRITELKAWTAASGGSSASVKWLVGDHLGTPRIIFDQTGSLANVSRHDYLPFGEELFGGPPSQPGVGGRTTSMGYTSSDNVRQKFTSQERDNETGLDYFLARYYSSTQGRFTGADPAPIRRKTLRDPRDLNRYSYVANNPLSYVDPTGEEKVEIIVRSYIPTPSVTYPPKVGATFNGNVDTKGRRLAGREGFKTEHIIVVETDASKGKLIQHQEHTVGPTRRLARGVFNVVGPSQGTASGDSLNETATRVNTNTVTAHISGNEGNPLLPSEISPGISYHLSITVTSNGTDQAASVQVTGTHDGYPAYEVVIVRPEARTQVTIPIHNPNETGEDPGSLAPPEEHRVNRVVSIDPRKKTR